MHASEFGGHVSPPGHLKWTADKEAPELPPSELRRFADYDHRRFRYSRVALPCVLGLMAVAAVLMALTFLQGPLGGARDLTAPQPRDYSLANGADWDLDGSTAGLKDYVIGLRLASFGFCVVPLAVGSLAVAANPMPQVLRPVLRSCALALCLVAGLSAAAFALGLLPDNVLKACPDLRFNNVNASYNRLNFAPGQPYGPFNVTADNPYALCAEAPGLEAFALAADVLQAVLALVTAGVLVYTTSLRRWAWGPGYIPVHVYPDQPRPAFPPPTPFTHVAETRRAYFWACALVLLVVTVAGFCATVAGVGLQTVPQLIDGDNRVVFTPGWSRRNTLIRVAVTAGCLAAGGFTVLDMWAVRSRVLAFFLAVVLFWLMVAAFVAFGFDLAEVLAAGEASCPLGSGVEVTCSQAQYIGTTATDLLLGAYIALYLGYEYVHRSLNTWDTYYFFADSEWLRNRSLFVERTDRLAHDWQQFRMASGRAYWYSAALGLSTATCPEGFEEALDDAYGPAYGPASPPPGPASAPGPGPTLAGPGPGLSYNPLTPGPKGPVGYAPVDGPQSAGYPVAVPVVI